MWKCQVQFETSAEEIVFVAVVIFTHVVWKYQVQFETLTEEIIAVVIFLPGMWSVRFNAKFQQRKLQLWKINFNFASNNFNLSSLSTHQSQILSYYFLYTLNKHTIGGVNIFTPAFEKWGKKPEPPQIGFPLPKSKWIQAGTRGFGLIFHAHYSCKSFCIFASSPMRDLVHVLFSVRKLQKYIKLKVTIKFLLNKYIFRPKHTLQWKTKNALNWHLTLETTYILEVIQHEEVGDWLGVHLTWTNTKVV